LGYGDGDDATLLNDMQNDYATVYLRQNFTVQAGEISSRLLVRVYCDDGAIVWINGQEVGRVFVTGGDKNFDDTGTNHEAAWEEILVLNARNVLFGGTNVIAIHALNATTLAVVISQSMRSLRLRMRAPRAVSPPRGRRIAS